MVHHLLAQVFGHLALQHVQQFLELLLRLGIHEVVFHQLLELTGTAFGQVVQLLTVMLGALFQQVVQAFLLGTVFAPVALNLFFGFVQPPLNAFPLGPNDVFQPFFEVVHHRIHVVLLQLLAALVLQLLHEVLEARHLPSVLVLHAPAHQVPKRLHNVSLVEDVLGQKVHQLVGVQLEYLLAAVPLGVSICAVEHYAFLTVAPLVTWTIG